MMVINISTRTPQLARDKNIFTFTYAFVKSLLHTSALSKMPLQSKYLWSTKIGSYSVSHQLTRCRKQWETDRFLQCVTWWKTGYDLEFLASCVSYRLPFRCHTQQRNQYASESSKAIHELNQSCSRIQIWQIFFSKLFTFWYWDI